MAHMYAVVIEIHDALAMALGCHDLYALVQRRRSNMQSMAVHAVLGSRCAHGISEHTTQAVTC